MEQCVILSSSIAVIQVHQEVIQKVTSGIKAWGFKCEGVCESPIKGEKSGNTEFLSYFVRDPSIPVTLSPVNIMPLVNDEDM